MRKALHELLAVEGDLEGAQKKIVEETKTTFSKKPDHFFGFHRTLEMFDENDQTKYPDDHKAMDTTVTKKLNHMAGHEIRYFDALLQKEATNQSAVAELIVDGVTIATSLPATFLLGMEKRLKMLRSVYEAIPTLPPGSKWDKDTQKGDDVYTLTHPEEKMKTAKTFRHQVLVPAQFPKEGEGGQSLPAQIEKWEETINVGKFIKNIWSGMVTPLEKSMYLERIDKLIRAFKQARQRANKTEIVKRTIGKEIFDFINGAATAS